MDSLKFSYVHCFAYIRFLLHYFCSHCDATKHSALTFDWFLSKNSPPMRLFKIWLPWLKSTCIQSNHVLWKMTSSFLPYYLSCALDSFGYIVGNIENILIAFSMSFLISDFFYSSRARTHYRWASWEKTLRIVHQVSVRNEPDSFCGRNVETPPNQVTRPHIS